MTHLKNGAADSVYVKTDHLVSEETIQSHSIVRNISWKILLIVCTFIYGSYTIFMHLCEIDGKLPFSTGSVVLLTELLKLVASAIMFAPEVINGTAKYPENPMFCLWFAIPAVLYTLNNNLAMYIQLEMDPATYQVLGNLKILTTAILYRIIIQREITPRKWLSLLLLMLAGIANSYGGLQSADHTPGTLHITFTGLFMLFCYCTISGLSGVVTEYILKKQLDLSLHLQNALLYIFGVILNLFIFLQQSGFDVRNGLLEGYSVWTWLVITTQAFVGITMGAIMKHSSNIARLFVISCAVIVATVLSMFVFGLKLNVFFSLAFVMVSAALYIYHT